MNSRWLPTSLLLLFSAVSMLADGGSGQAQHHTYGSYWAVGPGATTDLILEGAGGSISVLVTLYTSDGASLAVSTVNVNSQGTTDLSLSTLVPQDGTLRQGGLSLTWNGPAAAVRGKVQIHDDRGINASYLMRGGAVPRSF